MSTKAPAVPLPRTIRLGAHGLDVVAAKRALSRAGYIEWPKPGTAFTPVYGPFMQQAVEAFELAHSIAPQKGYGPKAHAALRATHAKGHPAEWAFDARAIDLERQEVKLLSVTPDQKIRAAGVAAAFYWYAHRMETAYGQPRPFPVIKPPSVAKVIDCSGFATNCHYAGGALNPNGLPDGSPRPWDGQGYTGTLVARGQVCSIAELQPLDLVFYGYTTSASPAFPVGSPTHVAVFVGFLGHVPMVVSNGHYPMSYVPVTYRSDLNHCRHYEVV